ncbi:hypothetical protein ACI2KR_06665 [Pseudomonas luteola]
MHTKAHFFPLPDKEFDFAGFSFPRHVAMLPKGTVAARIKAHTDPVTGPYYCAPQPNRDDFGCYLDSDFCPSLRWQWASDAYSSIDHTGWFLSQHCDEKVQGIVLRLPKSRGFLAGWSMGESMASSIDISTIYEDEESAALAADDLAKDIAENAQQEEYEHEEEAA